MLTILHTADWHLGQSFFNHSRDFEHAAFLDWLLLQIHEHQPHALLLAGDVFDTIHPSAAAQKLFYSFLAKARDQFPKLQWIITAGNHDAGSRLEAPSTLLESLNICVVGTPLKPDAPGLDVERMVVPVRDSHDQIAAFVLAVPFLRPADVPPIPDAADPWLDGIREVYRQTTAHALSRKAAEAPNAALIAIGHCHVAGGLETTDSERRLIIGHSEAISPETFPPELAYTALGHLHRPQSFQNGRVSYSGSPIPLSFTEAPYKHQILRLDFSNTQLVNTTPILIPRSVDLLTLPKSGYAELPELIPQLKALKSLPPLPVEQQPWLRVHVLETGPDPSRRTQIEQALTDCPVRLAVIATQTADRSEATADSEANAPSPDLSSLQPETVLSDEFQRVYNCSPTPELLQAFREILLSENVLS
jgi:exonuclease SbcD